MTKRNIVVAAADGVWIEDRPVEIVERKGIGHPDSLCDGIAERISVEYTRYCQEHFGRPLHHNFDKVQLVAGDVDVDFGRGEMLKPIRIQIAGRGTPDVNGQKIPIDVIAIQAARAYLRETMRYLDPDQHCVIDCYAGRGSSELVHTVDKRVTANDTSFGAAHWPRSVLERTVYETCEYITGTLIDQFPIGEDVKVMGCRTGTQIVLTCAVPFIAPRIHDLNEYREAKSAVQQAAQAFAQRLAPQHTVRVDINTADDEEAEQVYLTLTGTSAEMGDDGSVGRGNRVTGVIAPFRAASLEAAAGKNPISHVGKIYNVLALETAKGVVESVPEVREAQVYILSQIGHPLDQPLVATATVMTHDGHLSEQVKERVAAVIDRYLADIEGLKKRIMAGEVRLF